MDSKIIHEAIQKKFHISNKAKKNLPWCSGWRFNRGTLTQLFAELKFDIGAEIGVRKGRYSRSLCRANPNLKLFCIDPWSPIDGKYTKEKQDQIYSEAIKNLKSYNVEMIKKTSMEALPDIQNRSLDFVFIDGDHHFDLVILDIIEWSKKVKSHGIIACHDFYNGEVGIVKAVESYTHCHNIVPWYCTKELQPTAYWVNP